MGRTWLFLAVLVLRKGQPPCGDTTHSHRSPNSCSHIFFFKNDLLSYFGYAGSLLLLGLFSRCGERASLAAELRPQGVGALVAVARGLCSCGSSALEHRLNSCGVWA